MFKRELFCFSLAALRPVWCYISLFNIKCNQMYPVFIFA